MRTAVKPWTRASRVSVTVEPDSPENIAKQVGSVAQSSCFLTQQEGLTSLNSCTDLFRRVFANMVFVPDIDECVSAPCANGATCNDGVNQFDCSCVFGYEGTMCQQVRTTCYMISCRRYTRIRNRIHNF